MGLKCLEPNLKRRAWMVNFPRSFGLCSSFLAVSQERRQQQIAAGKMPVGVRSLLRGLGNLFGGINALRREVPSAAFRIRSDCVWHPRGEELLSSMASPALPIAVTSPGGRKLSAGADIQAGQ